MGIEKLREDFTLLREQCILIRRNYNTYNELFFSDSDKLLEKSASTFFNDIAKIMHRDWVLQACKLMDPASTKRKGKKLENITIALINSQLEEEKLMDQEITCLSCYLLDYGKKIKPVRDKRIVHTDRFHKINSTVLGETTVDDLKGFLSNIQKYCDAVGRIVGIGPLSFSVSSCPGDVQDLLQVLRNYYKEV